MSEQRFTLYLPKQGVRVLVLDLDRTVNEVIGIVIDKSLYQQFSWNNKPRIHQPEGLQFDEDQQRMLRKARIYLDTKPDNMSELRPLRSFFGDGPRRPDGQIDLFLMSDKIEVNMHRRAISLDARILRPKLVDYLYEAAQQSQIFLVRGTPGSGKTTLCQLLFNHIIAKEPGSRVSMTAIWQKLDPTSRVEDCLAASCYRGDGAFDFEDAHVHNRHWVLFDDAQTTYADSRLWTTFLKKPYDGFFVVLFASYGSQRPPGLQTHLVGTLNDFLPEQCMGLRSTRNGPNAEEIPGLYFLQAEFLQFITTKKQKDTDLSTIEQDLFDWIFQVTSGHSGAIEAIISRIIDIGKCSRGRTISLAGFFSAHDGPQQNLDYCVHGYAFNRGLPNIDTLKAEENIPAVSFLQQLLALGGPLILQSATRLPGATLAHQMGWITLDSEVASPSWNANVRADFPSLIHRSLVSYLLNGSGALPTRIQNMTLLQFVVEAVGTFSSNTLSKAARYISGSQAQPSFPEAHFQNVLYTAAWRLTGGQGLWLSPEFGTPQTTTPSGRIDFFVESWGIEVLREGDRVEDHMQCFLPGGAYHSWISNQTLKDYIVLDFRVDTKAMKPFPQHPNLFHISFQKRFYTIQNPGLFFERSLRWDSAGLTLVYATCTFG
ncbi:hypothetical protein B0H17DRAFT_250172 [Mycena rosella]|uniref:Uncharacterized protein n=1 Tax=Mycena rosella TaxID=1033263 RepID=A0AAD7H217_MYCRO|nr:hypothetical protein B0H17DRAFT_250172 [Mycena rosella]